MSVDLLNLTVPGVWRILSVRTSAVVVDADLAKVMTDVLEINIAEICNLRLFPLDF